MGVGADAGGGVGEAAWGTPGHPDRPRQLPPLTPSSGWTLSPNTPICGLTRHMHMHRGVPGAGLLGTN